MEVFLHPTLVQFLKELNEKNPRATEFLDLYSNYCGVVDDIVDESKSPHTIKTCALAATAVYNSAYWRQWGHLLTLLEKVIINQYFDSCRWEEADEVWKRQHAKVNSHAALMMYFAVVLIEYGDKKLEEVSLAWREQAYMIHKDDKI